MGNTTDVYPDVLYIPAEPVLHTSKRHLGTVDIAGWNVQSCPDDVKHKLTILDTFPMQMFPADSVLAAEQWYNTAPCWKK